MCGEHKGYSGKTSADTGSSPRVRGTRVGQHLVRLLRVDHPRVCGEHSNQERWDPCPMGSSPRVRGTRIRAVLDCRSCRIIPACAGNTKCRRAAARWSWDHPRVCGEHNQSAQMSTDLTGSSPRVRGTPGARHLVWNHPGIIPACAGNTQVVFEKPRIARDHPRVCGEHSILSLDAVSSLGSSPRVRGTLRAVRANPRRTGIIPACAGNTALLVHEGRIDGDHPRVCGEH